MNYLKMKVVGFDNLKGAIQLKFSSDLAEKNIDEYPSYDFNIVEMNDEVVLDDILKALAQNGWNIAFQQEVAEQTAKDNQKIKQYQSIINEEFKFSYDDLYATPAAEEQPMTEGLMVI